MNCQSDLVSVLIPRSLRIIIVFSSNLQAIFTIPKLIVFSPDLTQLVHYSSLNFDLTDRYLISLRDLKFIYFLMKLLIDLLIQMFA